MRLAILATGVASPARIAELEARPEFRKATRNMTLACAAALELAPSVDFSAAGAALGTVLATSHGELEATVQFLRGLGASGIARPILFQNSLHNATLGFVTQRLGLTGPGFTVSQRSQSGEDALRLAHDLIHGGVVARCLVLGVDSVAPSIETALRGTYPAGTVLRDGAGALLVAEAGAAVSLAHLGPIEIASTGAPATCPAHYDASAIEAIARVVASADAPEVLGLRKPDGTETRVRLGAAP